MDKGQQFRKYSAFTKKKKQQGLHVSRRRNANRPSGESVSERAVNNFPVRVSETLLQHFCANLKGDEYITHKILEKTYIAHTCLVLHALTVLLCCGYIGTPMAARSKEYVCWDCGFESCRGYWCMCLVNVVCCQVEVSASG